MTSTHYMTIEQMAKLVASFDYFELIDFLDALPYPIAKEIHEALTPRIENREKL